ncbi:hypothetical protein BDR26DRAFT_919871 [Obelidium mucronatum]|nr:hypothetical protein BDR26DRAFT_919871 [Obelidium mucronatum]
MKIPASHVKMGAQLAEQFPAFQAEFAIYGSFEKTYNKTLRLRDFIQLIATSFGVPILAARLCLSRNNYPKCTYYPASSVYILHQVSEPSKDWKMARSHNLGCRFS